MYYEVEVKSHIRVPPTNFSEDIEKAILTSLIKQFDSYVSKDLGIVLGVTSVVNIGEGTIIPGDGAAYYDTTFKLLIFKPEMQEIVMGKISQIAEFGAFMDLGALDGMIHISQTMDDFVSFSKSNVLAGKETKRSLKAEDKCRARIIAVSYKDLNNPKIGLTMRQVGLGKEEWLQEPKEDKKESKKEK
ncbi:DNA-directed RNA polymerase [Candidatus Woesearchaeota archaeon]|nr:DNA-directed RNA polymerase [Candidatus Woesearchaeota archaeon]